MLADLAQAVADALNAAELPNFQCVVDWLPFVDRERLATAGGQLAFIVPETWQSQIATRGKDEESCGITLAIWREIGTEEQATIRDVLSLTMAAQKYLRGAAALLSGAAQYAGAETEEPIDTDTYSGMRVVSAAITFHYRCFT